MPSSQYPVPGPYTSPDPCLYAIYAGLTSGLDRECIPESALGPKAASAEPSILTHRSMHNIHRSMHNIHSKDPQPSLTPVHVHILMILSSGGG